MAYTPTNWQCGDVITAEKLNKLEQAVASGGSEPLVVTVIETTESDVIVRTLDKTWQEIYDAFPNVYTVGEGGWKSSVFGAFHDDLEDAYVATFGDSLYVTDSPNGHPFKRDDK